MTSTINAINDRQERKQESGPTCAGIATQAPTPVCLEPSGLEPHNKRSAKGENERWRGHEVTHFENGKPVQALVSHANKLDGNMMKGEVNLGGVIMIAHLDSCATHCFLSKEVSRTLQQRGYEEYDSPVRYSVE